VSYSPALVYATPMLAPTWKVFSLPAPAPVLHCRQISWAICSARSRGQTGQQHGKFIAAHASCGIRRAKLVLEQPADEPQGFRRLPHARRYR